MKLLAIYATKQIVNVLTNSNNIYMTPEKKVSLQ